MARCSRRSSELEELRTETRSACEFRAEDDHSPTRSQRFREPLRRGALDRSSQDLQARPTCLRARSNVPPPAARTDRVFRIRGLGRRRGQVVRFSDVLGEPSWRDRRRVDPLRRFGCRLRRACELARAPRTRGRAPMNTLRARLESGGWPLLPLRLLIGYGFAAHGYAKLTRGPANFAAILSALGVPLPTPIAWATTLLELLGGVALMLGAAVALLSVPLVIVMLTAILGVHLRYGFSSIRLKAIGPSGAEFGPVGYELNLLYIAGLVVLALSAASPLSFDRWWHQSAGVGTSRPLKCDPSTE